MRCTEYLHEATILVVTIVWLPFVAIVAPQFGFVGAFFFACLSVLFALASRRHKQSRRQLPRLRAAFEICMGISCVVAPAAPIVKERLTFYRMIRDAAPLPDLGAQPVYALRIRGTWGFVCQNPKQVTDDCVEVWAPHLRNLGCTSLVLRDSRITDAGLKHLEAVTSLRYLSVENTEVTDDGLKFIANLRGLDALDVSGTRVTDDGLRHLVDMPALNLINAARTAVTKQGLVGFRRLRSHVSERRTVSRPGD
jgi:hypothetical protein